MEVNLFLYYYANKWLLDTQKTDLQKTLLFGNLFCFINGLCALTDHQEFDKNYKDIQLAELELQEESMSTSEVSFLDISEIIKKTTVNTELLDERDTFPFSTV